MLLCVWVVVGDLVLYVELVVLCCEIFGVLCDCVVVLVEVFSMCKCWCVECDCFDDSCFDFK